MKPLRIAIVDDDCDDRAFFEFLVKKNQHFEIVGVYDALGKPFTLCAKNVIPGLVLEKLGVENHWKI